VPEVSRAGKQEIRIVIKCKNIETKERFRAFATRYRSQEKALIELLNNYRPLAVKFR
jgi:hypothetical protein